MNLNPIVDWNLNNDWEHVYKPSSDTFFLCDSLIYLIDEFPNNSFILEVGSGSGYVTAFTKNLLKSKGKNSIHFTTDINFNSCLKTLETCKKNNLNVLTIRDNFALHFKCEFDIIIFNPPYVETSDEELENAINKRSIEASWAGGEDGVIIIYNFLNFFYNNNNLL